MLLAEAGLAALSLVAYGLLAWMWRPATVPAIGALTLTPEK